MLSTAAGKELFRFIDASQKFSQCNKKKILNAQGPFFHVTESGQLFHRLGTDSIGL